MFYNPGLQASLLASAHLHDVRNRLDIQNAVRYANALYSKPNKKVLDEKTSRLFNEAILSILDWQELLGVGFTAWKPEKLFKYYKLYSEKKIGKLAKLILEYYDEDDNMSDKELEVFVKESLEHLETYCNLASELWATGDKNLLVKLDKDYYNYAKEFYDDLFNLDVDE